MHQLQMNKEMMQLELLETFGQIRQFCFIQDSTWYDRHSVPSAANVVKQSDSRPVVPMARLNDICPVSLKDTDSEGSESNCSNNFATVRSHIVSDTVT